MSDLNSELRARIEHTDIELDRFEKRAAFILGFTLMLTVMSYSILLSK